MAMTGFPRDPIITLQEILGDKLEVVARYNEYLQACQDDEPCARLVRCLKDADLAHIQLLRDEIERQQWSAARRAA